MNYFGRYAVACVEALIGTFFLKEVPWGVWFAVPWFVLAVDALLIDRNKQ